MYTAISNILEVILHGEEGCKVYQVGLGRLAVLLAPPKGCPEFEGC